ncbi:MAG: hypothetical protein WAW36_06320 [Methylovulum miyakonense]
MPVSILQTLIVLICLLSSEMAFAKRLYRLEDQYGNTVFSDQVPPEQSQNRRELLSPRATVLEITERAKTKEQIELEARLTELRKEEEKLIAKQKVNDHALLSTFHSEEEIEQAMTVKMQEFDNQRRVLEGTLKNMAHQLNNQQKAAAAMERNGQQVTEKLLEDIKSTQDQMEQIHRVINANVDKQGMVRNEYTANIDRYLFLTQSLKARKPLKNTIPSIQLANALGLFHCDNDHQCNKAWEIARQFVNRNSTTVPDVYNEKLIMNRPPAVDTDISLTLSRIAITDNDYQLFLDIHCHNSVVGEQLCASQKIKDLRASFRAYVNNALSRTAQ